MPIRFRCQHCRKRNSIATRMVGQTVQCPRCGEKTVVIAEEEGVKPQEIEKASSPAVPPVNPFSKAVLDAAKTANEELAEEEVPRPPPKAVDDSLRVAGVGSAFDFPADVKSPLRPPVHSETSSETPANVSESRARTIADSSSNAVRKGRAPSHQEEESDEQPEYGLQLGRKFREFGEMDLTPAVDVTFQLLIFFMITLSFNIQKVLLFPPPSPEDKGAAQSIQSPEDLEETSVIARVNSQNVITVDDDPVRDTAQLPEILLARSRSTQRFELVVEAHPDALHETVVVVIDAGNAAGMQKIKLTAPRGDSD